MEFQDLTGKKFGHLLVLERAKNYISPRGYSRVMWKCICDCGRTTEIAALNLKNGRSQKCNMCKDGTPDSAPKHHGGRGTRLYRIWRNMRSRCENPKASEYKDYGGRGINICEEWKDFTTFREWALSNGYSEELSIDRIDNDGNYEPSNCKFSTRIEQQRNKRTNRIIEYKGQSGILKEWTEKLGIPYSRTQARINMLGWSVEDAFEKEKNYKHKRGGDD